MFPEGIFPYTSIVDAMKTLHAGCFLAYSST